MCNCNFVVSTLLLLMAYHQTDGLAHSADQVWSHIYRANTYFRTEYSIDLI